MKSILLLFFLPSVYLFAQSSSVNSDSLKAEKPPKVIMTAGVLEGGGSLVGMELEYMVSRRVGLEAGLGFRGYGFGINYHLGREADGSFPYVSLFYWNQGLGSFFSQRLFGAGYTYRWKKGLSFHLGLGYATKRSLQLERKLDTPWLLTYSLGYFFSIDPNYDKKRRRRK